MFFVKKFLVLTVALSVLFPFIYFFKCEAENSLNKNEVVQEEKVEKISQNKELQNELFIKELEIKKDDQIIGKPSKDKLMIVEYYSVTCKYCKDFHERIMPELKRLYIDTDKVVFIRRSLAGDQQSYFASVFSYCLKERSSAFTDILFSSQENWIGKSDFKNIFERYAMMSGADRSSLQACVQDEKTKNAVLQKMVDTHKHLGVRAYPTYFVGHDKYEGYKDLSVWKERINAKLAKTLENDDPKAIGIE